MTDILDHRIVRSALMSVLLWACTICPAHSGEALVAQANAASSPMRVAVTGFASTLDTQEHQAQSRILADLLTVRLSETGKFEMVERQEIEAITHEVSLSL